MITNSEGTINLREGSGEDKCQECGRKWCCVRIQTQFQMAGQAVDAAMLICTICIVHERIGL